MICDRCKTAVKETRTIVVMDEVGQAIKKQLCRGCVSRLRIFLSEPIFEEIDNEIIFEEELA